MQIHRVTSVQNQLLQATSCFLVDGRSSLLGLFCRNVAATFAWHHWTARIEGRCRRRLDKGECLFRAIPDLPERLPGGGGSCAEIAFRILGFANIHPMRRSIQVACNQHPAFVDRFDSALDLEERFGIQLLDALRVLRIALGRYRIDQTLDCLPNLMVAPTDSTWLPLSTDGI